VGGVGGEVVGLVGRGVHYTHRVAGALLLGPHMLFVGRWLDRRALAAAAKEEVLPRVRGLG